MELKAYLEILRPVNCVIGAISALIGFLNAAYPLAATFSTVNNWLLLIGVLVVYFFTAGASNLINDYFDLEIDKINRPERALPRGAISKEDAMKYFFLLCAISIGLSIVVGLFTPNPILIPVSNSFFLFVGYFYAWKGKKSGFPGNLIVGLSFPFGIPFGAMYIASIVNIAPKVWFFYATSAFGLISRELVKGMEDIEGDKKFNIKTIANTKGFKTAMVMSLVFSSCAILVFTLPAFLYDLGLPFIIFMMLGNAAVVGSMVLILKDRESKKNQKYASLLLKVGGFIGLVGYVFASFN
ncbi:MAG: geranylgeranylglycerol-phosphate geranylgeranyltransferase [Candidatus Hodarchaeota archaeon]